MGVEFHDDALKLFREIRRNILQNTFTTFDVDNQNFRIKVKVLSELTLDPRCFLANHP